MRAFVKVAVAAVISTAIGFGAQTLVGGSAAAVGAPPEPALPMGEQVPLRVAGSLAVSADGDLYIADASDSAARTSTRILLRLADGKYRAVAGNGQSGFSGDGGPAIDAELSDVTDMAFAPNGDLYIADGARVRVITQNGIIHTVVGNGKPATYQNVVANGTLATSAALYADDGNTLSLAVSPGGLLYITDDSQILYLKGDRLYALHNIITSGYFKGKPLNSIGQIAVDDHGDIDISGFNGWAIWQIAPNGVDSQITGQARRSGGNTSILERAPDDMVYGEDGPMLLKIEGDGSVNGYNFDNGIKGDYFWLQHFAFAPNGTIYADEIPGGGAFEAHQQLVSVTNDKMTLLWQQDNEVSYCNVPTRPDCD
jgi:hypothetical protein